MSCRSHAPAPPTSNVYHIACASNCSRRFSTLAAALAVMLGCGAGFAIAQRHGKGNDEVLDGPQQNRGAKNDDVNTGTDGLSPEQRKEVLQGLASLLATALHAKQQQQPTEELHSTTRVSDATSASGGGSAASQGVRESAIDHGAGLSRRRNARGQGNAQ